MVATHRGVRRHPRLVSLALAGALVAGSLVAVATTSAAQASPAPHGNLAEALQMSLYFYDANMSGPSRREGVQRLEWRGDSGLADAEVPLAGSTGHATGTNLPASLVEQYRSVFDPDGTGTVDLSGGYHDAGDHVKFGLPQSYSASTLGWGVYEFPDAFKAAGAYDAAMTHLRWFSDYFLRSTFRDPATGEVIAFNYMVGRGTVDHTYWGPPELQDPELYPRPATFAHAGEPASDQAAGAAAALTVQYLNTRDTDPAYAEQCLDTATALYDFAVRYRGTGNGDGFYPSSYDDDELAWAAVWLYLATDEGGYLTDIIGTDAAGHYTGYLRKIIAGGPGDTWQNIWVHCWDTVWGGVFAKLAPATEGVVPAAENERYWYYFRWNLEYWAGGAVPHDDPGDGNYLTPSPGGWGVISTWGSARYNAAAQFSALVFRKYAPDHPKAVPLTDWALSQLNYLLGDNPLGRSYLVGFGDDHAMFPHHRAAHGSWTNSMLDPPAHRHTLWGALVGGPDANDQHIDETTDYVYNEVAIDYNAAVVGALAGFFEYYGAGQPVTPWAPPAEDPEEPPHPTIKLEQTNNERTQVTVQINSYPVHPPRFETELSARYYFDISELVALGQGIGDVRVEVYYDESATQGRPATVTGPTAADDSGRLYYVELGWDGIPIYGKRDLQFALIAGQSSGWVSGWDPTNDWSFTGVTADGFTVTDHLPVYRAGELVFGTEPASGGPPVTPTPTPTPTDPSPSPTASPTGDPQGLCRASYTVAGEWSNGFQGEVVLTNTSPAPINQWEVRWSFPGGQQISQLWSGTYTQTGPEVRVGNAAWNGVVAAGGSVSFGFIATGSAAGSKPAGFTLNGAACTEG